MLVASRRFAMRARRSTRAEEFAALIARDGAMLRTKTGVREHPLIEARTCIASIRCADVAAPWFGR